MKKLRSCGRRGEVPRGLQETNYIRQAGSSRNISDNVSVGKKQKTDCEGMHRDLTWMFGGLDAVRAGSAGEEKGPGRF